MNRLLLQLAKLNVVRNIAVAFVIALGSIAITWVVNWKAQQNQAPPEPSTVVAEVAPAEHVHIPPVPPPPPVVAEVPKQESKPAPVAGPPPMAGQPRYAMLLTEGGGSKVRIDGGYQLSGFYGEDGKEYFIVFTNSHGTNLTASVGDSYHGENVISPLPGEKYSDLKIQLDLNYQNKPPVSAEQQD